MTTIFPPLRRLVTALLALLLAAGGTVPALVAAEDAPIREIQTLAPAPDSARDASPFLLGTFTHRNAELL
jgi:hypothetical protein